MKIIEKGFPEWTHKFTCKGCSSILEASLGDVIIEEHHNSSENLMEYDALLECPLCFTRRKVRNFPDKLVKVVQAMAL